MKSVFVLSFIIFFGVNILGCASKNRMPLTVTFTDVSGALSTDHTVTVKFAEEKQYENYFIDILVKTDANDVQLTMFQEFEKNENKVCITLSQNDGYVSLDEYKLFNMEEEQTESMVGYTDALATTFVVNSSKDATLTFLAVIGEKEENKFKKLAEVSKEYILKVKKHIKQ